MSGFDGSNALGDFYQYDPVNDIWTQIFFSGEARYSAVTMTFGSSAYLVTGTNGNHLLHDFWVFTPTSDSSKWTQRHPVFNDSPDAFDDAYTTIARQNGAAFVFGNYGYLTGGQSDMANSYTWKYDFALDLWIEKTPFEGPPVTGAISFSLQNRGFLATGQTQSGWSDQLWELKPNDVQNPNDN